MGHGPTYRKTVSATGAVFPVSNTVRVHGIELIAGTSVTLYSGAAATAGNEIVFANTVGEMINIPGCLEVKGLWAVSTSSGSAIVYYS